MKKNIMFKTVIVSLCLITLTGCMSKASNKKDVNEEKSVAEPGPFGKYEPPINVSFVRAVDDDMSTNILPKTPGETVESNRWLDAYRDDLGINITYDWTVKGGYTEDTYKQKMNLTLSSGDLPDVIKVDAITLKQLAESGEIEDLSDVWEEYASDFAKETYAGEGDSVLNSAKIDGRLMAIPEMDSSLESAQYVWIRQDWLDNLGLEGPKTMQNLLKISEAFTNKDPDNNGEDDTYGLVLTKDFYSGWGGSEGFFAGYHAYPNMWIDKDGKLEYGSVQPEVKTALSALAQMYQNGEIDKEFGIKEGSIVAELVAAGKAGINFGEQWNPMYPLISNYNNDENADWVSYPLVSIDAEQAKVPLKFRTQLYYAVRKGFDYPEVPVKMVNKFLETNWGEDSDFGYYYMPQEIENVGVWKFSPVTPHQATKNLDVYNAIDEARKNGTQAELEGEAKVVNENVENFLAGDKLQWGWEKIYGVNGAFKIMQEYKANDLLLYDSFVGSPTKTMIDKRATLEKMEKEVFIKIIMGEAPIDDFDKFVEDYYTLGGEQITKEVNDWKNSL
ncbi:extracellular solute-binding protein [Enterococcus innesii]|uniref:extracellular solute-binding protein n=1 Tax=Enterococcus innesii TaxID=2839759 RepID=UPI003DA3B90B